MPLQIRLQLYLYNYITIVLYYYITIYQIYTNIPKYSHTHISPLLTKLHWIPVQCTAYSVRHGILYIYIYIYIYIYKTLLLAHKAIHHDSPDNLVSQLNLNYQLVPLHTPPIRFYFNSLLNITYIQLTLEYGQYPSHTPGTLTLHPSVLHYKLITLRNY